MLTCGKLVVTFLLIGGIIWYLEDLGELGSLITRIKPFYVLLILFVNTLDRALMSFKWSWLLRSRNQPLPFFQGLKIYCASMVWGMLLPATIGADAFRAYSASRTGLDANEIVASILIERIAGFLSALLLGLLSLVLFFLYEGLDHRFYIVWWLGSVMLVGATVVFAASFNQSTFDLLHGHLLSRFQEWPRRL